MLFRSHDFASLSVLRGRLLSLRTDSLPSFFLATLDGALWLRSARRSRVSYLWFVFASPALRTSLLIVGSAALNLLHSSTPGCSNADCTCPVHSTFAGQLLSRVTCGKCGNITTSADPFLDLSLDLRTARNTVGVAERENTLTGCLTRSGGL